ncbi:glycerophosphodiester phosphodiesterase family protein [Roseibacterium sp. SDUM158017]|uniref:glycerophosphodiester phosphodiesterase n=1 Tax=Roseicyclus salinarum TaxID=3036773 RepID=UPI002415577F|nr:glycerophosphodiester phosphodiesterase family protein [Roseibacterium sp. SDUM158017]MDG4647283.1 glycerophosphodiester phosphodiesterase family protein [Roseibacterium sp. SDUM158017]
MERGASRIMACLAMGVAFASCGSFALAQASVQDRLAPGQGPVIAPFRGVAGGYPESSLAGMREALSIGAEMIDIQVQITADGHHVVFHDQFLNRMTDVEAVFEDGAPGGPTRTERAGRDYLSDYTLAELRQLRLLVDGTPSEQGIPTLGEALDLIAGESLAILTLNDFDLDALVAELGDRPTGHLLAYNIDPEILQHVVAATQLPAFVSIRRSRLFDTTDHVAILDAQLEVLGSSIALAHINGTSLMTPELLARTQELGVRLSVMGGREDFALEDGDTAPWQEALRTDAAVFWTTHPEQVLALVSR